MTVIHVLHTHFIMFMLIIGFLCFGMYFLREVSTRYTLRYFLYHHETQLGLLLKKDYCASSVLIFEADNSGSLIYNHGL